MRFALPKRQLGSVRLLGVVAVILGLLGLLFLGGWMAVWITAGWDVVQQGQWFGWGICAVGLCDRLATVLPAAAVVSRAETVRVDGDSSQPRAVVTRIVKQPAESDIQVKSRPDGTTYRVPAAGLLKGSKGLFLFAVVRNLFIGVFGLAFAVAFIKEPQIPLLLGVLFALPFVAVGVGNETRVSTDATAC